jgi:hypothetical protein
MKKNIIKLLICFVLFPLIMISCKDVSKTEKTGVWGKNKKECFCGLEFENTTTIDAIGMEVNTITVLNCDGTFTSGQNWKSEKEYEKEYNTTVGRSSDDTYNFTGTWKIINQNLGDFSTEKYTYIEYKSSNGKKRNASISVGKVAGEYKIFLSPIALSSDCYEEKTYHSEALGMFDGTAYFDGEIPKEYEPNW